MKNLKRLFSTIRPYRRKLILAAALLMSVAVVNLSILWIARDIINSLSGQTPENNFNRALGAILGLLLLQN